MLNPRQVPYCELSRLRQAHQPGPDTHQERCGKEAIFTYEGAEWTSRLDREPKISLTFTT